ncbi:hypothetical protein ACFL2R_00630 [Patescibacteria group bacterium]
MINKRINSEVAIGIIVIIVIIIGGLFWCMQKSQVDNVIEQQHTSLQRKTVYQKIEINNPQLKFSFEIPDYWTVEKRNSGEKQMTLDEKRDFLADVFRGDSEYADITREEFNKMSKEEIEIFFGGAPIISIKSSGEIYYTDTSWGQIDLRIISKKEVDKYVNRLANTEQTGLFGKIGKIKMEKTVIEDLEAIILTFPADIDEDGNESISKGGTGGRYIFIKINDTGEYLFMRKQSKDTNREEKEFEHLMETLRIEK